MTQEQKELLLKDLCARLPYNIKISIPELQQDQIFTLIVITKSYIIVEKYNGARFNISLNIDFKPYLRSMSSMTKEERQEYNEYLFHGASIGLMSNTETAYELIDWLNKNHFDYRGLIPMGLAIEVTKENNPYKE